MSFKHLGSYSFLASWILVINMNRHLRGDEADEALRSEVQAPANTVQVSSTLGGSYFVGKALVERSKTLQAQLVDVRSQIQAGELTSEVALRRLATIELAIKTIRAAIEEQKVLVSAFNLYSQTQEEVFPLGAQQLVIITGDKVKLRGWDGDGIKCVLEKVILAKDRPDDEEFDAMEISHELRVASDLVGQTEEQRAQREREFLASEDGKKLTEKQRAFRKQLQDRISAENEKYIPFQGKKCNLLEMKGLTGPEGNRQLSLNITSPGGGESHSSQWQRHASLTVFVPRCNSIAIRGCLAGLDIAEVQANLLLTTNGSRERDYEGSFEVANIDGNVVVDQAPVRKLVGVNGNVRFQATDEFVNSGTRHENGLRTAYSFRMQATEISSVSGNLTAWFLRTDLSLRDIRGSLDVRNEFGSTNLVYDHTLEKETAHRLISQSGSIRVTGPREILEQAPIYAHTLCGTLRTNLRRKLLDDVSFSTGLPRRNWSGFVTPEEDRFSMAMFERPAKALENRTRPAGLDLISSAGSVTILADD